MTCEEVRELIDAGPGGELPGAAVEHAAACAECAAVLADRRASEQAVEAALAGPVSGPADAELAERVIAALPSGVVLPIWPATIVKPSSGRFAGCCPFVVGSGAERSGTESVCLHA